MSQPTSTYAIAMSLLLDTKFTQQGVSALVKQHPDLAAQLAELLNGALDGVYKANQPALHAELIKKVDQLLHTGNAFFEGKPILSQDVLQSAKSAVDRKLSEVETEENAHVHQPSNKR